MNCIVMVVPRDFSEMEREILKDFEILLYRDMMRELTLKACEELKRDIERFERSEIKKITVGFGK